MRVTVTIPAYMEKQFERMCDVQGLSRQDTILYCISNEIAVKAPFTNPSGPTAQITGTTDEPDLYMLAPPERLKVYTFSEPGSCLRGEEIGEYHEIARGDKYAWQKFSRHTKDGTEGWEQGKNGKLCEPCFDITLRLWTNGDKSFT